MMSRRLIREEGMLCGGSSGAAAHAAVSEIKRLGMGKGKRCVVILPDSVRNYMSKYLSDQWMYDQGFVDSCSQVWEVLAGLCGTKWVHEYFGDQSERPCIRLFPFISAFIVRFWSLGEALVLKSVICDSNVVVTSYDLRVYPSNVFKPFDSPPGMRNSVWWLAVQVCFFAPLHLPRDESSAYFFSYGRYFFSYRRCNMSVSVFKPNLLPFHTSIVHPACGWIQYYAQKHLLK